MDKDLISRFEKMVDVNTPIIYIQDYDFFRVDEFIIKAVNKAKVKEWNPATGFAAFKDIYKKHGKSGGREMSLFATLSTILSYEKESTINDSYLILKNVDEELEKPEIKMVLQLISQRRLNEEPFNITIIIVSSKLTIPKELEKYISILEIPFPDEDEINRLIDEHTEINKYSKLPPEERKKLMPSLKGLTCFEIDRMLDMAMSSNGSLSSEDSKMMLEQKKTMVKKSGLLELVDAPDSMDDIGGLEVLKSYLGQKARIIKDLPEAQSFGVNIPKGIFIVGMPGCGKSLCAKASATLFNVPLLKMDIGSMMGKYVGESEKNFRRAIKIAEAAAPCILWIDEIEKAFSGIGGDNDIMTRMFGYFLSWMQDKKSSVYVIATANNAEKLPPELKRKGRFDEIFCVNLPNKEERKEIFKVQLNKSYRRNCPNINNVIKTSLDNLAQATDGFNGADIESVVNEAIEQAFLNGKGNLTANNITTISARSICISKSCADQIQSMKKEFEKNHFKNASK
jgi:ATP-dependent 26S proteasome regulatory subunit